MRSDLRGLKVETERLRLRLPVSADAAAAAEMFGRDEMFRYSERGAMTADEAWGLLLRHAGTWLLHGYGAFVVEEKETGRTVGLAGLSDFRRELGSRFDGHPEITWSIAPAAQGRGYATEAAAAALDWQARRFGSARTVCLIHVENAPSLRVAEKLGYRTFDRRDYRGYPAVLMAREGSRLS